MLFFSRTPLLGFFLAGFEAETTPGCSLPNAKTIQMPDEDKTVLCYANMGKAPHRDAAQICQDHDARLPLPTSDKDNRNLIHLLKLIGITEVSYWNRIILDTTDSAEEGTWLDSYGNELSYTNWAAGEPNDFKGQDYASVYNQNGKWGDVKGKEIGVVVCYQPWDKEVTQQCAANEMDSSKMKKAHTGTTAEAPKKPKNLIKFDLMREVAAFFKTKGKL